MAFADPLVITVNAVAQSMARIESAGKSAKYRKLDGLWEAFVSHQLGKGRIRSVIRLTQNAVVADPITAVNDLDFQAVSVLIDRPLAGFSLTQLEQQTNGLTSFLSASSNAAIGRLYGLES